MYSSEKIEFDCFDYSSVCLIFQKEIKLLYLSSRSSGFEWCMLRLRKMLPGSPTVFMCYIRVHARLPPIILKV